MFKLTGNRFDDESVPHDLNGELSGTLQIGKVRAGQFTTNLVADGEGGLGGGGERGGKQQGRGKFVHKVLVQWVWLINNWTQKDAPPFNKKCKSGFGAPGWRRVQQNQTRKCQGRVSDRPMRFVIIGDL
jgi:hypothetical protein